MPTDTRRTIVIAATPTSNGDLHVGHMAGPYLAGDIFARYLRLAGRPSVYTTCTDDSQTYVPTTAARQGVPPEQLAATCTTAIDETLAAMGISIAGMPPIDERYREAVRTFVTDLYEAGRLVTRKVVLPYAEVSGIHLYDGLISGTCPHCGAGSSGGACEACGHPNSFDEIIDPRYSLDRNEPVGYREETILVLPAEEYRDRLTAYYAEHTPLWRPNARRLINELLAGKLPDIPITMPGTWGIPAPFEETPGQILYPWIEAMPACMYATGWTLDEQPAAGADYDRWWRAGQGHEVVYFHGFDNVYHWALVDLVMLMAHGDRYVLPSGNVCNEFYDLAGEKFSTSRNHLIWCRDLLTRMPRDLVRFHLALTAPEVARTDFSEHDLQATADRLRSTWNDIADTITELTSTGEATLPVTAQGRAAAGEVLDLFRDCYELPMYSPSRAARTFLDQLDRLAHLMTRALEPGDLLLLARTVLAGGAPLLIDLAGAATANGADLSLTDPASVTAIRPFPLPHLTGVPAGVRDGSLVLDGVPRNGALR